jgi:hypothetical protein
MNNSDKIILDLCGGTGAWSKPYKDAWYDVRLVTLPENDVLTYDPPDNVYGILAAPPCTEFSPMNRNKYKKGERFFDFDRHKDGVNTDILNACLRIIERCNPVFYAIENPCGLMRKYIGRPTLSFQPYQYGDAWTKKTDIWGRFIVPEPQYTWESCPKLNLYIRPKRKRPSIAFLHKSAKVKIPQFAAFDVSSDAAFRAITPPGFASAFFLANR